MRVLHLIPSMGGGGAELQLAYLAGELPRLGWETHVALGVGGVNLALLEASDAELHRLPERASRDPRRLLDVSALVRRLRPGVVQTWLPPMDVLGGLAALGADVPWLLTERSSEQAYPPTLKHRLRTWLGRRAAAIVCNSGGGAEYWRQRLPREAAIGVIPNALPLRQLEAAPEEPVDGLGIPPDTPIVLFVGRFDPDKNLPALYGALRAFLPGSGAVAVLCGDGPLRAQVESELGDFIGNGQVRLAGHVRPVWSWMKKATVMLAPSRFEGSPNAVMEAAACGCPLVLSDIAAHRELLGEDAAVIVDVGEPEAVAAALCGVLGDPVGTRMRARRAAAIVHDRSAEAMARLWVAWYERLGGARPVSARGAS